MTDSWLSRVQSFLKDRKGLDQNLDMHKAIVKMIEAMGYGSGGGYCVGIARMAMRAIVLDKVDEFNQRLEKLARKVQEHHGFSIEKVLGDIQKNDKNFYRELRAFFDGVVLQQAPHNYNHLSKTPSDIQKYSPEFYQLVQPPFQHQEMAVVKSFSGMYTDKELESLFTDLQSIASDSDKPLCLQLSLEGHDVFASYDPNTKLWQFVDANYLPIHVVKDASALVNMIKTSNRLLGRENKNLLGLKIEVLSKKSQKNDREGKITELLNTQKWKDVLHNQNQLCLERIKLAILSGENNYIEWILTKNEQLVNKQDNVGNTPLILAVDLFKQEIVTTLLSAKTTDINLQNNRGDTPLIMAFIRGNIAAVELLLTHGADVARADHSGETALMKAVTEGNIAMVQLLLANRAEVAGVKSGRETDLMHAVNTGESEKVQEILSTAENDSIHLYLAVSLMMAVANGNSAMVELLLKHGADVTRTNNHGKTALMMAVNAGNLDIIKAILSTKNNKVNQNNFSDPALSLAVKTKNIAMIQELLSIEKIDVNNQNTWGWSPLMFASVQGSIDVVQLLLDKGAKTNLQNDMGQTALMLAAKNGFVDVVRALVRMQEDVEAEWVDLGPMGMINQQDQEGMTALMIATQSQKQDVIQALLEYGADVTLTNNDKKTAYDFAQGGSIRTMIADAWKKNSNEQDEKGMTALMRAVESKDIEKIRMLMIVGEANAELKNKKKQTALQLAQKLGYKDVAREITRCKDILETNVPF